MIQPSSVSLATSFDCLIQQALRCASKYLRTQQRLSSCKVLLTSSMKVLFFYWGYRSSGVALGFSHSFSTNLSSISFGSQESEYEQPILKIISMNELMGQTESKIEMLRLGLEHRARLLQKRISVPPPKRQQRGLLVQQEQSRRRYSYDYKGKRVMVKEQIKLADLRLVDIRTQFRVSDQVQSKSQRTQSLPVIKKRKVQPFISKLPLEQIKVHPNPPSKQLKKVLPDWNRRRRSKREAEEKASARVREWVRLPWGLRPLKEWPALEPKADKVFRFLEI